MCDWYRPYTSLYNPRFVYFLPTFWSPKTFFQGAFFLKFWSYVRLVFKSGLWWRPYGSVWWFLKQMKFYYITATSLAFLFTFQNYQIWKWYIDRLIHCPDKIKACITINFRTQANNSGISEESRSWSGPSDVRPRSYVLQLSWHVRS